MKKLFVLICLLLSNFSYSQWFYQQSNTINSLKKIHFINNNTGYIAGGYSAGIVLKTTNAGTNWTIILEGGDLYGVNGICFLNELTGFISDQSTIRKTTNGGLNWTFVNTPYPFNYYGLKFFNENTGFVSGTSGEDFYLYKTTNGGIIWERKYYTVPAPTSYSDFLFVDNTLGFNIKESYAFKTTNNGENWSTGFVLSKEMEFINSNTGISVWGNYFSGAIYKTTNRSASWMTIELQSPGISNNAIDMIDSLRGFVVCDSGIIKYTLNGGNSWSRQSYPGRLNIKLNDVLFLNNMTGFIAGDGGYILKTTTGGLTFVNEENKIIFGYKLEQNYPNPFNPITVISYQLPAAGFITLNIYDINGKLVKELVNEKQTAGSYNVNFSGGDLPSGVYYYSLIADGVVIYTKKSMLLK